MACKRPIVTSVDEDSDYFNMINENHAGIAVSADDPDMAVKALLEFYNNRKLCEEYGEKGYLYGHELYSRSNNMNKYLHFFKEVIKGDPTEI